MSDMTMVERVARALMLTRGNCDVTDWGEAEWNPAVARAIREARAAIEAMRTPTLEMERAIAETIAEEAFALAVWRSGVDAALSEQKP